MRVLALLVLLFAAAPSAARAAAQEARVPVAARDLARGAALTADDIAYRAADAGVAAANSSAEVGVGWVTRRVIRAGETLRPPAVAPPEVIRAGEPVEVRWSGEAIELRLQGVAAASAREGERVWVRLATGWRVEGEAVAPGQVEIRRSMNR